MRSSKSRFTGYNPAITAGLRLPKNLNFFVVAETENLVNKILERTDKFVGNFMVFAKSK